MKPSNDLMICVTSFILQMYNTNKKSYYEKYAENVVMNMTTTIVT